MFPVHWWDEVSLVIVIISSVISFVASASLAVFYLKYKPTLCIWYFVFWILVSSLLYSFNTVLLSFAFLYHNTPLAMTAQVQTYLNAIFIMMWSLFLLLQNTEGAMEKTFNTRSTWIYHVIGFAMPTCFVALIFAVEFKEVEIGCFVARMGFYQMWVHGCIATAIQILLGAAFVAVSFVVVLIFAKVLFKWYRKHAHKNLLDTTQSKGRSGPILTQTALFGLVMLISWVPQFIAVWIPNEHYLAQFFVILASVVNPMQGFLTALVFASSKNARAYFSTVTSVRQYSQYQSIQ